MKSKNIPLRMCLVCRQHLPKKELLRIVKKDEKIVVDSSQKSDGRGCYICKSSNCVEKFKKNKVLNRCFHENVEESVYDDIIKYLKGEC